MVLNEFKIQQLTWDKATKQFYEKIEANSGDTNGRKLNVQIINNSLVENLTGVKLNLAWRTKNNKKYGLDAFKVIDATKGIFEISYTTEMLSNVGKLKASLVMIDSVGRTESDEFDIDVKPSVVNDGAVQSENSFTALTEALVSVGQLETKYAPRLNEVTAQLAQTDGRIDNLLVDGTPTEGNSVLLDGSISASGIDNLTVGTNIRKTQTGEAIQSNAIKPKHIENYQLMTDYVSSENKISLPVQSKGKYQIEMEEESDIFISTGNVLDLMNLKNGTYTSNGLTILVSGNHVEISGTATVAGYFVLSDLTGSTAVPDVLKKTYQLPKLTDKYTLTYYNDVITSGNLSLCVRNATSGNIMALSNGLKTASALYNDTTWASLYLYFGIGNYDMSFDISLQPVPIRNTSFEVLPDTKKIQAKITRLDFLGGHLFSENLGTGRLLSRIPTTFESVDNVSNKIYLEKLGNGFNFYIKGTEKNSDKHIKYTFVHTVFPSRNADNWRLDKAYLGSLIDGVFIQDEMIVNEGEWEMAIKLTSASDFIGGLAHGSEVVDSLLFYVDGSLEDITKTGNYYVDSLKIITKSKMYNPSDETTHIANHLKVIDITTDGIITDQKVEWLSALPVTHSYLCMLPIIRGRDSFSSKYITKSGYADDEYIPYDIGTVGWVNNLGVMTKNRNKYHLHAEETGISATVEMLLQEPYLANNISFVQNTSMYNKVYFSFCPYTYTTTIGEIWHAKYIYKINVSV